MNLLPLYHVNTLAVFLPDRYNITEQIAEFAAANFCFVRITGTGSGSTIRVAGPMANVEAVYERFKEHAQV